MQLWFMYTHRLLAVRTGRLAKHRLSVSITEMDQTRYFVYCIVPTASPSQSIRCSLSLDSDILAELREKNDKCQNRGSVRRTTCRVSEPKDQTQPNWKVTEMTTAARLFRHLKPALRSSKVCQPSSTASELTSVVIFSTLRLGKP